MDRAKVIEDLERQLETAREQLARESNNARQFAREARTQASRVSELQLEIEVLLREVRSFSAACMDVGASLPSFPCRQKPLVPTRCRKRACWPQQGRKLDHFWPKRSVLCRSLTVSVG